MAGILANSVTATMSSGDTAVDKSVSGYIGNEQIVLTTSPAGSGYSWALSRPSNSTARSDLDDATAATPTFTPDVPGMYVVTVTVDSVTAYVLRIAVLSVAVTRFGEVNLYLPIADSQVPTPTIGRAVYFSSTQNAMVEKRPDGTVHTFTTS